MYDLVRDFTTEAAGKSTRIAAVVVFQISGSFLPVPSSLAWPDCRSGEDERLLPPAECKPHLDRGEAASSSPGQALPITESSDKSGKRVVTFLIVRSEGFARLSSRW